MRNRKEGCSWKYHRLIHEERTSIERSGKVAVTVEYEEIEGARTNNIARVVYDPERD